MLATKIAGHIRTLDTFSHLILPRHLRSLRKLKHERLNSLFSITRPGAAEQAEASRCCFPRKEGLRGRQSPDGGRVVPKSCPQRPGNLKDLTRKAEDKTSQLALWPVSIKHRCSRRLLLRHFCLENNAAEVSRTSTSYRRTVKLVSGNSSQPSPMWLVC